MAKPRKELPSAIEAKVVQMAQRKATVDFIYTTIRAMGANDVSRRTLARIVSDIRTGKRPIPEPQGHPPLPESPDEISADTPPETLAWWIDQCKRYARIAMANDDLDRFAKVGRLSIACSEALRKSTPIETPGPDQNPDMILLANQMLTKLHALVDQVANDVVT